MNTATQAIPTFEVAYRNHRGHLFGAFARLAGQGFVAQPIDAADIVHDFFLEEWPAINRNFDPDRQVAFSTYLHAAFVRFARARIQRLHRQRGMLLAPQDLMALQDRVAAEPSPEHLIDLGQATAALQTLSAAQRQLVERWLTQPRFSERQLARELGTSRYKLREQLVEAVGLVSLHFAAHASKVDTDHRVAEAIWRHKLTPAEAAARLGLAEQQVRNARARNYQRVLQALSSTPVRPARSRTSSMNDNALKTLIDNIFNDTPIDLVESDVELQAPALVHYLADSDEAVAEQWQRLPAERLGRVYEAIARGMGPTEADEPEIDPNDPFVVVHTNDRRAVGRAFSEALLSALPNGLFPLLHACEARRLRARRRVAEELRHEPDVIAGGSAALALSEFALTPAHLVVAASAIEMFIRRGTHSDFFPKRPTLVFVRTHAGRSELLPTVERLTHEGTGASLTRPRLVGEICDVTTVEKPMGETLLDWLVEIAPYVRSGFSGFTAAFSRDNVVLDPIPASDEKINLYGRWSTPPEVFSASESACKAL